MSADIEMDDEIEMEEGVVSWRKEDVLVSPQDVSIECKGEQIRTHSVVIRRCAYFAAIFDNVELDSGSDNTKIIPLPDAFYYNPKEMRKFVVAHYFTLDEADAAQLKQQIGKENIFSLAQLSYYFDSPVFLVACDESLASNHCIWFPGSLLLMAQLAIKEPPSSPTSDVCSRLCQQRRRDQAVGTPRPRAQRSLQGPSFRKRTYHRS
jgi:hypothetical protein